MKEPTMPDHDPLAEALAESAPLVHGFARHAPLSYVDHPTEDWLECPGDRCRMNRAALAEVRPKLTAERLATAADVVGLKMAVEWWVEVLAALDDAP